MKLTCVVVSAAVAFALPAIAAEKEAPVTVPITRLSMDIVMKMAKASASMPAASRGSMSR